MKKKIIFLLLFSFLISSSSAFAFASQDNIENNKIALAGVVSDVLKQTIYGVGTSVLNKYMNPTGVAMPNYIPQTSTTITPAPITQPVITPIVTPTTTPVAIPTTPTYTPSNAPEQMIPVS